MPEDTPDGGGRSLPAAFTVALNLHGHAFQHRVIHEVCRLASLSQTRYRLEVAEFPVRVQDRDTRIDFILRSYNDRGPDDPNFFLVCECKRANPSLRDWCFCKVPTVRRNADNRQMLLVEYARHDNLHLHGTSRGVKLHSIDDDAVQLGFAIKGKERGDSQGDGRDVIENTLTQVCRGVNGFVEHFRQNARAVGNWEAVIVPVIFTTAKLWVSRVSLSKTNILTGKVAESELVEVPWVVYQYHISRGIKHSGSSIVNARDLPSLLEIEYIRSVVFVNAGAIGRFLTDFWFCPEDVRAHLPS